MAALTRDKLGRNALGPSGPRIEYAIATSQQVFLGSGVQVVTSSGRVRAAAAATGRVTGGVVVELNATALAANGTGNTGGTAKVVVEYDRPMEFAVATAIRTTTSLGVDVFWLDDDTVAGTAVGTAGVRVAAGELIGFSAANKSTGYVAVRRYRGVNIS